jgi:hypothetical protein
MQSQASNCQKTQKITGKIRKRRQTRGENAQPKAHKNQLKQQKQNDRGQT